MRDTFFVLLGGAQVTLGVMLVGFSVRRPRDSRLVPTAPGPMVIRVAGIFLLLSGFVSLLNGT